MKKILKEKIREFRNSRVKQMYNEISIIIGHDEYVDGEISQLKFL